jgi:hypothetical protein
MTPLILELQTARWNTPASPDEAGAMHRFLKRYFVPTDRLHAWLLYQPKTHLTLGTLVGHYRPNHKKIRTCPRRFAVVEIHPKYQEVLKRYGPDSLRWNGKELVVAIGTN